MAKHGFSEPEDMLRMDAEHTVMEAMRGTPEFKKAVNRTMGELKKVRKGASPLAGIPRPKRK